MSEDLENRLDKMLGNLEDSTSVEFFNNESYAGFEIRFSRKNFGWGAVTISFDLKNKEWLIDNEAMDKETCADFLKDAAPLIMEKLFKR